VGRGRAALPRHVGRLTLALPVVAGVLVTVPRHHPAVAAPPARPNILLIVSDDQAWSTFSPDLMPTVFSQIVDQGVLFRRAYVNTALCCPSRSQILTGLYEHHTGVDGNAIELRRPTVVQALHDSGYRTMLAGKYLNSWATCDPRPEFDRWACTGSPAPSSYSLRDPWVNEDGVWTQFPGFQTDVLADQLSSFIDDPRDERPFFGLYAPTSPHLPANDPRYDELPVAPPRPSSFDANTLTDDAPLYSRRPSFTEDEITLSDGRYQRMARAVRSLDDGVATILSALGDRSRDTIVIYVSDNGFLYGEHRRAAKTDAYEESVNVPMAIRYPALATVARTSRALVANVDIAPTIAELAGLDWEADGRTLSRLIAGTTQRVRTAFPIEHCRGVLQWTVPCSGLSFYGYQTRSSGFEGIVTTRYKYVRFDDGSRLLVDLSKDPEELVNLAIQPGYRKLRDELKRQLDALMGSAIGTTIVTGPGGASPTTAPAFTFFSPSRLSTYRCRLTTKGAMGEWRDCSGGIDVLGPLEPGTYGFEVTGTDERGHADPTAARREFTVAASDAGPVIISGPPPAQTDRTATFAFRGAALVQCRLRPSAEEAEWTPCAGGTQTYADLTDGWWTFEVRDRSASDQPWSEPVAAWPFRIDTAGPSFTSSPYPASTSQRSLRFQFAPDEPVQGRVTCTLDRRPSVDCSSGSFITPGLRRGPHELSIEAVDEHGNLGITILPWTIDIGAPLFHIGSRPDRFTSETTARIRLSSPSDENAVFLCTLDNSVVMPCGRVTQFGPLGDGPHRFTAWALDAAMNQTAAHEYRWTVDTLPPALLLSGEPKEGAITSSRSTHFDVKTNEPADLFCSLDAAEFAPCVSPVSYTDLADGAHTFDVYVVDRAGIVSITTRRSWTIDPSAPALAGGA
jgi:N-acetylglucosamine-6-sulfatase